VIVSQRAGSHSFKIGATMTIDDVYVHWEATESEYLVRFASQPDPSAQSELRMCRKATRLGSVEIDQFWMSTQTLYGQRNQAAVNQSPILNFWWDWCGRVGSQQDRDIRETYLLAMILPHARGNGSRRVFADSILNPSERRFESQAWISELEPLLASSRNEELDEVEFKNRTANSLGPPEYDAAVFERYEEMTAELFSEAHSSIEEEGLDAISPVLEHWQRLMKSIGRRRGNELEKQVLDILSYECRTALHRGYSAVWKILLEVVARQYSMSEESYRFHELWHFDHCRESAQGEHAYFHLFHGHIFALHPACGPLLQTNTGGALFGQWLQEETLQSYRRVLNALSIAVAFYGGRGEIQRLLRHGSGRLQTVGNMETLEER